MEALFGFFVIFLVIIFDTLLDKLPALGLVFIDLLLLPGHAVVGEIRLPGICGRTVDLQLELEPGEEPFPAAIRELGEETGITAGRIDALGAFLMSPGFSTEVLHIYLARELRFGAAHPDEDELLNVEKYSLQTLVDMVMRGEICDAKSAIAILKTARFLELEKEAEK